MKYSSEQFPFTQIMNYGHEQVLYCYDQTTGLKAIIAIHNTNLGPSLGGTRMWMYSNEQEALHDVLRLSRGMTYKAAITGLKLGGGKAVIIGDSRTQKNEALFRRFGQFVDSLNGNYITAEDVGITPQDIQWISKETKHTSGLPKELGGSGDPSPITAYGVYMGMKAACKQQFGTDSLNGKRILVQGVGHVGTYLIDYLAKENATILVSDIFEDKIKSITNKYPVEVIDPKEVYQTEIDIYSPCALGATINDKTLTTLKCKVIAGAANNQLENEEVHGKLLVEKNIIYAPDFLINAGGIINCYSDIVKMSKKEIFDKAGEIYNTTLEIFEQAQKNNIPTYLAANQLAESRFLKK